MKLYLQSIINDIPFDQVDSKWQSFDLVKFSENITLYDFQKQGLENALKGLWFYFKKKQGNKQSLLTHYQANGFYKDLDYKIKEKKNSKTIKYLLDYNEDYPVVNNKISFACFINRMSFWMATGSGKTLIIVKLIEFLGKLIAEKELPTRSILFLAHREDLLNQFKSHVEKFNSFNFETSINLKSLKDYEDVKRENALPYVKNEVTVFYHRSDLISDNGTKEKVDFKNYDNNGEWYILLDEAHKGEKDESKRQTFYSILSRNGFLFNFSATFTDPIDEATCAYNFNLSKFIEQGYGKHIYVSDQAIKGFKDVDVFSDIDKQKIVLKTLLLLTYINKNFEEIREVDNSLYHRPLLLTLVNKVSKEDSDLELFFREIEKIAKDEIRQGLLQSAKNELVQEFSTNQEFEFEKLPCLIDTNEILKLDYKDILKHIFNSKTPGNIEVLKIPSNKNELIFKLMTAEKPFALIKIGDISSWLKDKLEGYEINESFENESYFRQINHDDSDINILMGSRSFYEGWDSNRPNLILFINIGVGKNAKKFVLQSVGRGVRIEPQKYQRKRLQNLFNTSVVGEQLFQSVKDKILLIESLFVFGTNVGNLTQIIKTLKEEKQYKDLGQEFVINEKAKTNLLLIPFYKKSEKISAETKCVSRYSISQNDLKLTVELFNHLGNKVALVKYNCAPKVLKKVAETTKNNNEDKYYNYSQTTVINEPELLLGKIFDYFAVRNQEFDKFKELDSEIVHFKKIQFSDVNKYKELKNKIETIKNSPEKEKELCKIFKSEKKDKYDQENNLFEEAKTFQIATQKIKIKYLSNHYYHPLIVSESGKVDYLNHIISVPSEWEFICKLENYLKTSGNSFTKFDWWMFSKLDETLDEVYIPYYNQSRGGTSMFKPDFIFWIKKDNNYFILFVDPKGTAYTDYQFKVDGYSFIFEENGKRKIFKHNNKLIVRVYLLLFANDISQISNNYRRHWLDNVQNLTKDINNDLRTNQRIT